MKTNNDAGASALPSSTELAMDRTLLAHDRTLLLATLQQWQLMKKLRRAYPRAGFSLAPIMAAFISLLGILALIAVILRQ
jgi:hypothetical protein